MLLYLSEKMWPFKSSKEKLNDKEYQVHARYLSLLSSNFQRKYAEFEKTNEERNKFDAVILSLHKHPRISAIIQQPKYLEKLAEKSKSFGITGIDIQRISDAVKKYDDFRDMTKRYKNILSAYESLLSRELSFYEEINTNLTSSGGTLSSLQRVFEREQNKKILNLINSLITILGEIREHLIVRVDLLKKLIKTYKDVSKYGDFQKLIRQNILLDEKAIQIYNSLYRQKEQLPAPLQKRINAAIKNVNSQSLATSFLLAITLLANACGEKVLQPSGESPQQVQLSSEEKQIPSENSTEKEESTKKSKKDAEPILDSTDSMFEEMQKINAKYESKEIKQLRAIYEGACSLIDKSDVLLKKGKNMSSSDFREAITHFKEAVQLAKLFPREVKVTLGRNTTQVTYTYDSLEKTYLMSTYLETIRAGLDRVLLLYDLKHLDSALEIANLTEDLINFGKKNSLPENRQVNELSKTLFKWRVRIIFEKDS